MRRLLMNLLLSMLILGCQPSGSSDSKDVGVLVPGGDGYILYRSSNAVVIQKCPPLTSFFNPDGTPKKSDQLIATCNQGKTSEEVSRFKTSLTQTLVLSSNYLSEADQSLVEQYKVGADSTQFDLIKQQRREVQQELEPIQNFLKDLEAAGIPDPAGNLSVDQLTKKSELEAKLVELDQQLAGGKDAFAAVEEVNNRINKLVDSLISAPEIEKERTFIFSRDGQSFFYNILASYLRNQPAAPTVPQPAPQPQPQPTPPTPTPPPVVNNVDVEAMLSFVFINRGSFVMGSLSSEKGRESDEQAHGVNLLNSYEMMAFEVTQQNWFDVMGDNPSKFRTQKDCPQNYAETNGVQLCPRHPVESVSWERVQEFMRRLTDKSGRYRYRLPTEAEWEWAARAGTKTAYPFGDSGYNLKNYAWFEDNSQMQTHPVGSLTPTGNANGFPKLYDMFGNVWEWTSNWHAPHPETEQTNPTGPASGSRKVIRGCGWSANANACRSANRDAESKDNSSSVIGFRMVRVPK